MRGHQILCLLGLGPRQYPVYERSQCLVIKVGLRPQRGYDVGFFLGIAGTEGDPDEAEAFEGQRFHIKYTFDTAQPSHTDQTALDGGAPDVVRQIRAANMVNDDVGPVAARQGENPVRKTSLADVHHMVGALGCEQLSCPVRPCCSDNKSGSEVLGQLDALQPH